MLGMVDLVSALLQELERLMGLFLDFGVMLDKGKEMGIRLFIIYINIYMLNNSI